MALPQDDLKWFGEGFDGFPRRIPEDCVDYSLFVINAELGPTETQSRLNAVQTAATELTQQLTQDYVWQREPFNLHAASENGLIIDPMLPMICVANSLVRCRVFTWPDCLRRLSRGRMAHCLPCSGAHQEVQ